MSGICGICELGVELSARIVAPMLDALALTDETERTTQGGNCIALGVARRWKFQQATVVDHISVVADADLIDFADAAAALAIVPAAAASLSVAELLARLYLRSGVEFAKLLHGAYSFALWDEKSRRLVLSIDRFGEKSIYWRREGGRLLFASRPAALRVAQRGQGESRGSFAIPPVLCCAGTSDDRRGDRKAPPRHCSYLRSRARRRETVLGSCLRGECGSRRSTLVA